MLRAPKLHRPRLHALLASPSSAYGICPKLPGLRFRQAVQGTDINPPQSQSSDKMAQAPNQEPEVGTDSLTSLGEAYAARCEEEGFGGVIYGKSMNASKDEEEDNNSINQDSPAKFPGNEEKEERKYRNQDKEVTP